MSRICIEPAWKFKGKFGQFKSPYGSTDLVQLNLINVSPTSYLLLFIDIPSNKKTLLIESFLLECGKVHLGVVLDSSSSHEGRGKQQAAKMMDLAKQVSHLFPVSHEGNSVGMVVYGGSPQPSVVHFDKFLDQKSMDQAIDNASDPNLEIRIGKALTLAQKNLFSQPYTSKHKVLLLVTDGFSSDDVSRPAIELKRRGIEVFCLGVGNNVNQTQLDFIASKPKSSHVFLAPFNDADALMGRIQKEICQSATRAGKLLKI